MKTLEELKKLDSAKLLEELAQLKKEYFKTSFEVKTNQAKNSHMVSTHRKQIARVKTLIKEKNNKKAVETVAETN